MLMPEIPDLPDLSRRYLTPFSFLCVRERLKTFIIEVSKNIFIAQELYMNTAALTAISPLDGRYQDKVSQLRSIFSEFGLIKFRVIVEINWLELLLEHGNLPELPKISSQSRKLLKNIIENFSE